MNVESLTPDADLDVSDPLLFEQDIWGPRFRLLRRERPVNYCHASPYGPYWSITRFEDVQEVELDHLVFSSDSSRGGIRIDNRLRDSFISRDPPRHTIERRTIAPVSLSSSASITSTRWACQVLPQDAGHRLDRYHPIDGNPAPPLADRFGRDPDPARQFGA